MNNFGNNSGKVVISALNALIVAHPELKEDVKKIVRNMDSGGNIPDANFNDIDNIKLSIQAKVKAQTNAFHDALKDVKKTISELSGSKHISSPQSKALNGISTIPETGDPIDTIVEISAAMSIFAQDAIRLRSKDRVILNSENDNLKDGQENIIAGDVAWSSRKIVLSLAPLIKTVKQSHADNPGIVSLYETAKNLSKKSAIDFYQAIDLMEESTKIICLLQKKKNQDESKQLTDFQCHLKSIHESLIETLSNSEVCSDASSGTHIKLQGILGDFKEASEKEKDPEKLQKLILDNVSSMKKGLHEAKSIQDSFINTQKTKIKTLVNVIKEKDEEHQRIIDANTRLVKVVENVKEMSLIDQLTNIPNRKAYDSAISGINDAVVTLDDDDKNKISQNSLIVIDIDHFKKINDTFGHSIGDKVLSSTAELIKNTLKKLNTSASMELYRYGGEEFVVVCQKMNFQTACKVSEILRKSIAGVRYKVAKSSLSVTASFGVAPYTDIDRLGSRVFEKADTCLYKAKRAGRNRVVIIDNGVIKAYPPVVKDKKQNNEDNKQAQS